jgi:hypothetical protein
MQTWDRLADQLKVRLIEIIRENLPGEDRLHTTV